MVVTAKEVAAFKADFLAFGCGISQMKEIAAAEDALARELTNAAVPDLHAAQAAHYRSFVIWCLIDDAEGW